MTESAPRIHLAGDRVAIVGPTGLGKSELGLHLFERAACRRMLVDPKHSFRVTGVQPVADVASIDWSAPVIHVWPPWHDQEFANELYRTAFARLRHALILTDEAQGVSDSSWKGSGFAAVQTQGRELEIGHIVLSQRPVEIRREAFTEATHTFLFRGIDDDDLKLARRGFTWLGLERLRQLLNELPRYGFLWVDSRTQSATIADPLPEALRRRSLVFRRGPAA